MKIQPIFYSALFLLLMWAVPVSAQNINEAAEQGDLTQVKNWVEKDPQWVNFRDKEGWTPLHWASWEGHLEVLEFLIESGADVNARDNDDVTPLHNLSYQGNAEAMDLLIRKGADVNAKENGGMVPLIYAAYAGQEAATVMLVENGAEVNAKENRGLTAVDIAVDKSHEELARYLLSKGGELTPVADPEITELADNIHEITFCYQQCTNMLVLDGPDGMLLVDTGYRRTTEKFKTAVSQINKSKNIIVINTHQHDDHIGGNSVAGDDGAIISFENLGEMTSRGLLDQSTENLQGVSGTKYGSSYTLVLNGSKVRLIPLPGAHTDGDMLVHFEEAGIVHMGDLLITQSFPSLTRGIKIAEYMAIFKEVIDIFDDSTIFVGGHGQIFRKQELVAYQDMLKETIDIVTRGLQAGKSTESMQQDGVLNKYSIYDNFIPELNKEYWIETVGKNYAAGITELYQ